MDYIKNTKNKNIIAANNMRIGNAVKKGEKYALFYIKHEGLTREHAVGENILNIYLTKPKDIALKVLADVLWLKVDDMEIIDYITFDKNGLLIR